MLRRVFLLWCVALALCGCDRQSSVTRVRTLPGEAAPSSVALVDEDLNPRLLRRFAAIARPADVPDSPRVTLGRLLYFEPLLSRTGKVSCNSCHPLDRYGATDTSVSVGVAGRLGRRNAPSVYNAAGHFRQFWDGRAASLADQVEGPITNPIEMDMQVGQVLAELQAIPGYRTAFARAFPDQAQPISMGNLAIAVAEFERGLTTPGRWDRYLNGDAQAITPAEKAGAKLFANLGCMVCHAGANVGGTMFERLGALVPWPEQPDRGRSEVTHNAADDMVFKVPSLRNVARTAPYFHDGSIASLDTAVRMMARHQLGVDLSEEEARSITAWLGALTGEIPRAYVAPPTLPVAVRP